MPQPLVAQCACGNVQLELQGQPIECLVCYCDDCQAGARQIQALMPARAAAILDADGGSNFLMYHKRRVRCVRGAQLLRFLKLKPEAATHRVVATCCQSAMYLAFDDRRFWVDIFRARLQGAAPPVRRRIYTRFMPDPGRLPRDVPSHPKVPPSLLVKLMLAGIAQRMRR